MRAISRIMIIVPDIMSGIARRPNPGGGDGAGCVVVWSDFCVSGG
ncbi:MAG: hypothetical protein ACREB8_07850 [Pseudolabrys sp.]